MNIFIDDSGSFSWFKPGVSLFCGMSVTDAELPRMIERFIKWKRSVAGLSKKELKGSDLTVNQLSSFMQRVLPKAPGIVCLTVVGASTIHTKEHVVEKVRDQTGDILAHASHFVKTGPNPHPLMIQQYREMAGWVRNRSPQNFLWMITAGEVIYQSLQHLTVYYVEPEFDDEFRNIEIILDQSFIQRDQHISFWKEILRTTLISKARLKPFIVVDEWHKRSHPFVEKYEREGVLHLTDLYRRHLRFLNSARSIGLQIVDILAHTAMRYHRNDPVLVPYSLMRRRIVGEGGREMTILHLGTESINKDGPENHVRFLDLEEMQRRAKGNDENII